MNQENFLVTTPSLERFALNIDSLTDEVEAVLVSGWRDEEKESFHIAAEIVRVILDKCYTVVLESHQRGASLETERGNQCQ